jgi:hypothetical protein
MLVVHRTSVVQLSIVKFGGWRIRNLETSGFSVGHVSHEALPLEHDLAADVHIR